MVLLADDMFERIARPLRSTARKSFTTGDLLPYIRECARYAHVLNVRNRSRSGAEAVQPALRK
jgi:hypothetical protein